MAPAKTKAILLIGRKRCRRPLRIMHGAREIAVQKRAKYLGVTLDQGLTFSGHIEYAKARAERAVEALGRIMPRTWGAGEGKRRLLASVADSVVLYAAPVWRVALCKKRNRARLRSAQRVLAIRICRAYRTVGTLTALGLAGQIPWEHKARACK